MDTSYKCLANGDIVCAGPGTGNVNNPELVLNKRINFYIT
jgi:hypothetical protein